MTRPAVASPPSQELGYVVPGTTPNWSYFSGGMVNDGLEEVPELQWPNRNKIFHRMRTDAQIDALIKAVVFPLLRLNWSLNPNGAPDEVVQDISTQLNIPIKGQTEPFIQRGRKRFNHAEHLRLALLAPTVYGHMMFEQVGDVDPTTLKWKLSALEPRMPQTIQKMQIARNGDLVSVTQYGDAMVYQPQPIPSTQLVPYVWEREGGNWAGRSMMRPLYRYWLLKDRMLRIDAMKNERYGLGVPVGTAAPGGDPAEMQRMASSIRAVEQGGVGVASGAKVGVQGITGTLPDTLASINLYNEEMARSFLAMFMQLGQTDSGSRALGESFVDFFVDALAAFANWYKNTTNLYVIEDIVDWNWGEDVNAPLLEWTEREEQPLSIADLANLIKSGALIVDAELQQWIRKRYSMPDYTGLAPLPTRPGTPSTDPQAQGAEEGTTAPLDPTAGDPSTKGIVASAPVKAGGKPSPGTPKDKRLKENQKSSKLAKVTRATRPSPTPVAAREGQRRETNGQYAVETLDPESEHVGLPYGRTALSTHVKFLGSRGCSHVGAASAQTVDDATIGHRDPTPTEVAAATDFQKLQQQWTAVTKDIVTEWGDVRASQIDALYTDIVNAVDSGDTDALASLVAPVAGSDKILAAMTTAATEAIADAKAEAVAQGVASAANMTFDVNDLALSARADAVATLMARDLGAAAARNALLRFGTDNSLTGADVAAGVRTQLEALSDGYLNDTLGGAMTQAQNSGRRAVMDKAKNAKSQFYASELLDQNTCDECSVEDGTQFGSLSQAEFDYPAGGYYNCAGGARCRGTIIAVYGESP